MVEADGRAATLEDVRRVEIDGDKLRDRFDAWLLLYQNAHAALGDRLTALEAVDRMRTEQENLKSSNQTVYNASLIGAIILGAVALIVSFAHL
jgi:hypothetical protein